MGGYLKGNYSVKKKGSAKKKRVSIAEIFEHRAFEKLGGSIAFVMKSNRFTWSPDEKAE